MSNVPAELTLGVDQEIEIGVGVEKAFDALVARLGTQLDSPGGGNPLPMKLEAWPGGRWYRPLEGDNGHLWGHVQVIKRPTLLEITGPMFMSYPVLSHMQFRLTATEGGALLTLRHQAFGLIQDDHREGVVEGWKHLLKGIRDHAER